MVELRSSLSFVVAAVAALVSVFIVPEAHAMKIQAVKSPGGIEAWLVEEHSVPLVALRFSFDGGNAQDPAGKNRIRERIHPQAAQCAQRASVRQASQARAG